MTCLICKLENPPTATTCDCGYSFTQGKMVAVVPHSPVGEKASPVTATMIVIVFLVALAGTALAAIQLYEIATAAQVSAPQQGAGAAMAAAYAIVPYCFARSIQAILRMR
jgi:hypothetical protein